MIQDLLWRCPLCASNDVLKHNRHWLYPDTVDCTACGAQWRVRRVVGDNYYLKVTHAGKSATTVQPGLEQSITSWYDLMKQTIHLVDRPESSNLLEAGEKLYLASGQATLWTELQLAIPITEKHSPAIAGSSPLSFTNPSVTAAEAGLIGTGRLFLTNRRMIWRQSAKGRRPPLPVDFQTFTFPLQQVNGIYAILNLGLLLVVGMQLYTLRFAQESPLKWVTYTALLAPQVQVESGHRIRTSHY